MGKKGSRFTMADKAKAPISLFGQYYNNISCANGTNYFTYSYHFSRFIM